MPTDALKIFRDAEVATRQRDVDAGLLFESAAHAWAAAGKNLLAGLAMQWALVRGFGSPSVRRERASKLTDILDRASRDDSSSEAEQLTALSKLASASVTFADGNDRGTALVRSTRLRAQLASRLRQSKLATQTPENLLVRGSVLKLALEDEVWHLEFPDAEIRLGVEWGDEHHDWCVPLPSAFLLETQCLSDFKSAEELAAGYPGAFTTPALRGWREAVAGFSDKAGRAAKFQEAAEHFESDERDAVKNRPGGWSSENIHLWAPYFRSRHFLARLVETPARGREMLELAAHHADSLDNISWTNGHAIRYLVLLQGLRSLLRAEPPPMDRLNRALGTAMYISGPDPLDLDILGLLGNTAHTIAAFQADPAGTLLNGDIQRLLERIDRLPFLEPGVVHAVTPTVAEDLYWGPKRDWLYRELAGLRTEAPLRMVFHSSLQALGPKLVEHSHGPLEYGKDLLFVDHDDRVTMFQVKCGDIGLPEWRDCRHQLDEMFEVPPFSVRAPAESAELTGVLVCNGHAKSTAALPIKGYIADALHRGRRIEFWDLDRLVRWIRENRLEGVVRDAIERVKQNEQLC